jgi:hypothetical protein
LAIGVEVVTPHKFRADSFQRVDVCALYLQRPKAVRHPFEVVFYPK